MSELNKFKDIVREYKNGNTDIFIKVIRPFRYVHYDKNNYRKTYKIYILQDGAKIFNTFLFNYLESYKNYFSPDEINSIFLAGFSTALAKIKKYTNNAKTIEFFKNTIKNTFLKTYKENFKKNIPTMEGEYGYNKVVSIDKEVRNQVKKEKEEEGIAETLIPISDHVDNFLNQFDDKLLPPLPENTGRFAKLIEEFSQEIKLTERQRKVFNRYLKGLRPSQIAKEVYPELPNNKGLKEVDKVKGEMRRGLIKLAKKHGVDTTDYLIGKKKKREDFSIPEYQKDIELLNMLLAEVEQKIKTITNINEQIKFYYDQKTKLERFINHAKHEMKYMHSYYLRYDKNIFQKVNKYFDKKQKIGG